VAKRGRRGRKRTTTAPGGIVEAVKEKAKPADEATAKLVKAAREKVEGTGLEVKVEAVAGSLGNPSREAMAKRSLKKFAERHREPPPGPLGELINITTCRAKGTKAEATAAAVVKIANDAIAKPAGRRGKAARSRRRTLQACQDAMREFIYSGVPIDHAAAKAGLKL